MIRCLLTGALHANPEARISKKGTPFTTAKLKADASDGAQVWCSLIAFAELGERLATLKAGAAISVSGRAKVGGWVDRHGDVRGSLDVTIDEIATLSAKPPTAPARSASAPPGGSPPPIGSQVPAPAGDFDDDIPF